MKPTRHGSREYCLHIPITPLELVRATLVSWRNGSASVSGPGYTEGCRFESCRYRWLSVLHFCSLLSLISEVFLC